MAGASQSKPGEEAEGAMAEPSKVILVRNVRRKITTDDLIELVQPFGAVHKIVLLPSEKQAFVEMEDVEASIKALEHYSSAPPKVRGKKISLQFSSFQELPEESSPQQQPSPEDYQEDEPSRILSVFIHHVIYDMTIDVLHKVFSCTGFVEKIIRFQDSDGFHALVQYQSQESAIEAKNMLHERNVYHGCCQMFIQFAKDTELQVDCNNEISWDFTKPSKPTDVHGAPSDPTDVQGAPSNPNDVQGAPPQMNIAASLGAAFGGGLPSGITGNNNRRTISAANLEPNKIDAEKLYNLFSLYGNVMRIKFPDQTREDHALVQMADGVQAELAVHFLKGAVLFGKPLDVKYSEHPHIKPSTDTHDFVWSIYSQFNINFVKNYMYCCAPTRVIHVSGLPRDITKEKVLAHLGELGTIVDCMVLDDYGKKQAVIVFEDEAQAIDTLVCKHGTTIDQSTIRLAFSQLQSILGIVQ